MLITGTEAEGEGAAESTVATVPSPSISVPASLHASLMARLDRLGPAKEVAQIGAAVGREFSHGMTPQRAIVLSALFVRLKGATVTRPV